MIKNLVDQKLSGVSMLLHKHENKNTTSERISINFVLVMQSSNNTVATQQLPMDPLTYQLSLPGGSNNYWSLHTMIQS